MKALRHFAVLLAAAPILWASNSFAQRSKDGAKVVAAAVVVNEYINLTAPAAAGATSIKVASNTLNTNGRFPGVLAAGDLIMIIQIQGAGIVGTLVGTYDNVNMDSLWGGITAYNNCGNWEFAEVKGIPSGVDIDLDCPLKNSYSSAGVSRTQVVRVPRYSSLTINAGGTIGCDSWSSVPNVGGICALEVENNTIINTGGSINTSGNGFRGGQLIDNTNQLLNLFFSASTLNQDGSEKGEGIVGYKTDYSPYGGMYMRGAPANGGGGGNIHNGGGGGGANGGNPASWNGHGMPDISTANNISAWNLQYAGFAAQTSSGGGQGGYAWSANVADPTTQAPGNVAAWGGLGRSPIGGYGGRPLDYSTGRLFLGGGGGAGDQDNSEGGAGANGGGLIYLMSYGTVSTPGTGSIISNGSNGSNTKNPSHRDGAGGGGAGGTIVVNSVGAITGISITANGGTGGSQLIIASQAEGPGGGGSGGYISISNGAPVMTVNGGNNGTTTSTGMGTPSKFPPNGATKGGVGSTGTTTTNFVINAPNVTICAGQAATLNASLTGTVPGGTTITWYDALVGGNILPSTGGTLTTSVIVTAGTYTYYVSTCPGTYHQPVLVTVTNTPLLTVGPDVTICGGGSTTLSSAGAATYTWSPTTGLSNSNISNPVANPVATTTYILTATSPCGTATASVVVTVNSSISSSITGNTTICGGGSTTLTASGGGNYSWNTGATTAAINVSPTATTAYSVNVTSGSCSATATSTVTVGNSVSTTITGPTGICAGGSATLTASGGGNYAWSTSQTTSSITVTPTGTTTYSVMVTAGTCTATSSITVNVGANITASITGNTTICGGSTTTLTASGGSNYVWNTGSSNGSILITPLASTSTTYTVIASSGTCKDTATFTVNSLPPLFAYISGSTVLCQGDVATLSASMNNPINNSYIWNTGSTATSITVAPSVTTTYSVVGFSGSCSDTVPYTVTVIPQASATVCPNVTICAGQSTVLSVTGGTIYIWSNGSPNSTISVSPLVSSTYTVISGIGACSDTDSVSVMVIPSPTVTITASNTTICGGDIVTLNASGGSSYTWSTGATSTTTTASPNSNTTYTVVASSGACTDTATVTITVSPPPNATIAGSGNICQGLSATLTASQGTYLWSTGETTATINPNTAGNYSVVVSVGSCTDTAFITTTVVPNPTASAFSDITIIQGQSADLSASGGATYAWDNSMTGANITVSPNATTVYCVIATDANGCTDSACVTVTVELCANAGTLYLPNAFSPNGDGDNDSLQIYYLLPACIDNFHLILFDRWGERIYETTDKLFRWDGSYKGWILGRQPGAIEVFSYYMKADMWDGKRISKKGNISIIR